MVEAHARPRVYGVAVALVVTVGILLARIAASPTAEGFRHPMAAAPGDALYTVSAGRALLVGPEGGVRPLGVTGPGQPLALAADGRALVLGTDAGVAVSPDGGATWRRARVPRGHYPAVWVSGSTMLAGAWAGQLWYSADAGGSWHGLGAPGGGEYQAIAESRGVWYVATLTGVWSTADAGRTWEEALRLSRVTALEVNDVGVVAGDWRGDVRWVAPAFASVSRVDAGIWALSGDLAATTDGIRRGGTVLLAGREVSALVSSGGRLYAGVARGPVLVSDDGGAHWRTVVEG